MTKFNHCPNCAKMPPGGIFGISVMNIYECKMCKTLYCYLCGDKRCPNCGGKERTEAGKCYKK